MSFDAFIEAGVYDPQADRAEERRELLDHLLQRGYTAEQICAAAARASLVTDVAVLLTSQPWQRISANDIAERCQGATGDVQELRANLGLPISSSDQPEIPEDFVEDFALFQLACSQFGRERSLAFTRVVGAAASTILEAGREMFTAPLRERGASELEVSQANEIAILALRQLPALFGRALLERGGRDGWFEAGLLRGEVVMAVAFVDLVGSTAWASRIAPDRHVSALGRFEALASRLVGTYGGRVVKFIGDEAMIVSADPEAAAAAAAELCAAVTSDVELPPARGAVGWGEVSPRGGDYFGDLVNLVARAAKEARPGSIVVTEPVAQRLDPSQWTIENQRSVDLRGVADPTYLFDAAPRTTSGLGRLDDPRHGG